MFLRFFKIFAILINEYIKFNFTNWIYKIKNLPPPTGVLLVSNIANKLEEINIVYLKIFQSLCINKDFLNEEQKNFLLKYTDNVPFKSSDIDYEILDSLEKKYNIRLDISEPLNSGIVSIVFKGIYGNDSNKVVIKVLKNNIQERLESVFFELEFLCKLLKYIPYVKSLHLDAILIDNKELLLNQTDFIKEVDNIKHFKNKNKNMKEFRIPLVYDDITDEFNNVIVMENITGLKYCDVEKLDKSIQNEFGKLILKFGYVSVLYNNALHCDLHPGNIFFYINEDNENNEDNEDNDLPKYQLGLIDFGIVTFPCKKNQNTYYNFINTIFVKKNCKNCLDSSIKYIIEPIETYNNISDNDKKKMEENIISYFTSYFDKDDSLQFIFDITRCLDVHNLRLSEEANKVFLSIQIANNLAVNLCDDIKTQQVEVFNQMNNINKLLSIE
tara:strand:- start:862 stop:2187 length:1326 start_codon:yes stop_codon:yes gene_type:complete